MDFFKSKSLIYMKLNSLAGNGPLVSIYSVVALALGMLALSYPAARAADAPINTSADGVGSLAFANRAVAASALVPPWHTPMTERPG